MTGKPAGRGSSKRAQTSAKTQKNRRFRNAKISEYRLRRVVECFARDVTVRETAAETKLSRQSIDAIFMRIRERIFSHGLVRFDFSGDEPQPVRYVVNAKHRGAPEKYHHLYAAELIHRALTAQQIKGFEELQASNPAHIRRATKLHGMRQSGLRRYVVFERLRAEPGEAEGKVRPFAPLDFEETSTILINERMLDPHTAFFRYLWKLLLTHPL